MKIVTKASGVQEEFNSEKFRRSLKRVGASDETIDRLARDIETRPDLTSTKAIYRYALGYLKQETPGVAARYAVKRALLDLGPAGFPFEKFVAEVFKAQNFSVQIDQVRQGFCVDHEIDVIAQTNHTHILVECKFHNHQQLKTDIKVVLYVKARFDDLMDALQRDNPADIANHEPWIVTNTKFTTEAIAYGECRRIHLLGWGYPLANSLPVLIDRYHLHPVTALTSLTSAQKAELIRRGCVLCKDMCVNEAMLRSMGLASRRIARAIKEVQHLCMQDQLKEHQ